LPQIPQTFYIPPRRSAAGAFYPGYVYPYAGRGRCPHPQTFFKEKSLTKNLFNRKFFDLPRALPLASPKPGVR
jgi:hypothetical protein